MKYPTGKYAPDHPWSKAKSVATIFVYLTEVPPTSGGSTAFPPPPLENLTDSDMRCHPMPGRVLIFSQNLWHAGEPIRDHIKYVIRSDVMALPTTMVQRPWSMFMAMAMVVAIAFAMAIAMGPDSTKSV